jgi:hypothetical protein
MLEYSHEQVLQTLIKCGLLSKQSAKSIKGQLFSMTKKEAEEYLKKIIGRLNKGECNAKKKNRTKTKRPAED